MHPQKEAENETENAVGCTIMLSTFNWGEFYSNLLWKFIVSKICPVWKELSFHDTTTTNILNFTLIVKMECMIVPLLYSLFLAYSSSRPTLTFTCIDISHREIIDQVWGIRYVYLPGELLANGYYKWHSEKKGKGTCTQNNLKETSISSLIICGASGHPWTRTNCCCYCIVCTWNLN